jgi:hypothetical protein
MSKDYNHNLGTGAGLGDPTAKNSDRQNEDGNTVVTGERHDQKKAMKVSAESRFGSGIGPTQPTRQNEAGNIPVTGEKHDQAKAEKIGEDRRW